MAAGPSVWAPCLDHHAAPGYGAFQMRIAWLVPPIIVGGGGHRNIFRAAYGLEQFGHEISIHVVGECVESEVLSRIVRIHFYPIQGNITAHVTEFTGCDFVVATHWSTVDLALQAKASGADAVYFMQDYEPMFYPVGSDQVRARNTYDLGLSIVALGQWCADALDRHHGVEAGVFQHPIDANVYKPGPVAFGPRSILFFAKPEMPRRCFELGLEVLEIVHRRLPNVRMAFFGSEHIHCAAVPFPFVHHGLVTDLSRLAGLYREASVGLAFSPTNPSSVPFEMMACGLPVVDMDLPGAVSNYGGRRDIARLAPAVPQAIADTIIELLESPSQRLKLRAAGIEFAATMPDEEGSCRQIEALLQARQKALAPPPAQRWQRAGSHAFIDLTSFCNLRCTYCYQADPAYGARSEIDPEIADKLVDELASVGVGSVTLAGDGEVTTYKGWEAMAERLAEAGIPFQLLSNLSYNYKQRQIEAISRAAHLTVSFDTYDLALHADIRRRSDLSIILRNLVRITEFAASEGRRVAITQNVVVSDRTVSGLPRVVEEAALRGVTRVALLNIIKLGQWPGAADQVSVTDLAADARRVAIEALKATTSRAESLCLPIHMSDHFTAMMLENDGGSPPTLQTSACDTSTTLSEAELITVSAKAADRLTRLCMLPWRGLFIKRDGQAGPCCYLSTISGSMRDQPLADLVEAPSVRELRSTLLKGCAADSILDGAASMCAKCPIYPIGTTRELERLLST